MAETRKIRRNPMGGRTAERLAAMGLGLAALFSTASAQNQQLARKEADPVSAMTADDLATIFQSVGYSAVASVDEAGAPVIEVTAPGAGTFYVLMRDCAAGSCRFVQPYGIFSGDGVTLGQLNEINLTMLQSGSAMLLPDGDGIIGARIFLNGGISAENLRFQLGVFIQDVDRLVAAIEPGSIATVSYSKTDNVGFKSEPAVAPRAGDVVNQVGANAPRFMTEAARALFE